MVEYDQERTVRDTLAFVRTRFAAPVCETLRVEDFGPSGTVAILEEGQEVFSEIEEELKGARALVGCHDGILTVSF